MNHQENDANNDAQAARRRALQLAMRQGEAVIVTPSGEVEIQNDAADKGLSGIQVPEGKLAREETYGFLLVSK